MIDPFITKNSRKQRGFTTHIFQNLNKSTSQGSVKVKRDKLRRGERNNLGGGGIEIKVKTVVVLGTTVSVKTR